jgi:hypothetical protein
MKRANFVANIIIALLVAVAAALIIVKFVLPRSEAGPFEIKDLNAVTVYDLNENPLRLTDLLDKDKETYCLMFELTNCYSCIFNGIEELRQLRQSGAHCLAIAVHDLVYDIEGWSRKQAFSPFFVLKKIDFYRAIQSPLMPVLFTLKNGRVTRFRFITP